MRTLLRRYGDLGLAVALAVGWVVELAAYDRPADYLLAAGAGVVAALSLAVRRRLPLAAYAVMMAMFLVSAQVAPGYTHDGVCPLAVLLIGLYSLGAHARGLEARLAPLGVAAAVAGVATSNPGFGVGEMFFYCMFCGLPWATGLAVRLRVERVRDLEARHAALQEEAARVLADERARIARELHDVVSHAIAVTVLQSRGSAKLVGRDDDAVTDALDAIEQTNTAALADMRRLLTLLRGDDESDEPAPTLDRVGDLVEQVRASGLPVEVSVTGRPLPVPPGVDLSAYRIVQEALTNVLKHGGPAARAVVQVHYDTDGLDVEVSNTGRVDGGEEPTGGHGLLGIRERVLVAGGTVETGPRRDGYVVRARMPYLVAPR